MAIGFSSYRARLNGPMLRPPATTRLNELQEVEVVDDHAAVGYE